MEEIFKIFIS